MADPAFTAFPTAPTQDLSAQIQALLATPANQNTGGITVAPVNAAPRLIRPPSPGPAPVQPTQTAPAQSPAPHPAAKIATVSSDPVLKATVDDLTTGMSPELKAIYAAGQKDTKATADAILKNQEARKEVLRQEQALRAPDPRDFPLQNYGTPPPNAPNIQPLQAFSGWGVALAMIGSLLTRRPLTAALNIGAAAMKSYTQARWQDYTVQHQIWQDSVDQAMKQNELELQKYKMAWDSHANDLDKLDREMTNIALDSKDELMLYQLKAGMHDEAFKLIQHREDLQAQYALRRDLAAERAANRQPKTLTMGEQWAALWEQNFVDAHKRLPTADEFAAAVKTSPFAPNAALTAKTTEALNRSDAAHNDIQDAIGMVQNSPLVVGAPGYVSGLFGITGWMTKDPSTAQLFRAKITRIKDELTRQLGSRSLTGPQIKNAQDLLPVLDNWAQPATAIKALKDADNWLATIRGQPWNYKSKAEVDAAYLAGTIDDAEYQNILITQFHMSP